jgi:hypothetical protein
VITGQVVDGILLQWGERLFYPANRSGKGSQTPKIRSSTRPGASAIRRRIETTVRRAPQVMVKVTGGGRGMLAISAHFRYISKNGRLDIEDDREVVRNGKETLHDLVDQWRYGGALIDDIGHRREAFNIMLSMPAGTDANLLHRAAREFAHAEFAGHRYVMVLHEHQANPHVHLSVRAASASGHRLNPRKADLQRWRETFAEKLRGWGIEADATRQVSRGVTRNYDPMWRVKAREDGRLRKSPVATKVGGRSWVSRAEAMRSWAHIIRALDQSGTAEDRNLAERVAAFVRDAPIFREQVKQRAQARPLELQPREQPRHAHTRNRGPDLTR